MLGLGGCQLDTAGGFYPARPWCFDIMVIPGLKTCLFQFPGDQTVAMFYPVDLGSSLSLAKTWRAVLASELPKRYSLFCFSHDYARVCGRDCSVHTRPYTSAQNEIKLSIGGSIGCQGMHHYSFFVSVLPSQLK